MNARLPDVIAPALKFRFTKGSVFNIHEERHVFQQAFVAPRGTAPETFASLNAYHFVRQRDRCFIILTEEDIDDAIAAEVFRPVSGAEARGALPALAPNRGDSFDVRLRTFWTEQWDRILPGRGRKAGEAFISRVRSEFADDADFKSLAHAEPSFWTIRRWADTRGCTGSRLASAMADGRKGEIGCSGKRVERAMATACARFFSGGVRHRLREYERLVKVLSYLNARSVRIGGPQLRIPDRATFYRRCCMWEDEATTAARSGKTLARRIFAGTRPGLKAGRALEVVLVDGTTSDTHVVMDEDGLPLGRPTIMLAIDVCTRAIVGLWIGFEGEGLMAALATFDSILRPKSSLIAARPDLKGAVNLFGLPNRVVMDNRWANIGKSARSSARQFGIDLEFAPVGNAEYKSIVERAFATIIEMVFRAAPGAIPASIALMKRMGLTGIEAVIPIDVLEDRLIDAVAAYNVATHQSLGCSPWVAWNHALSRSGVDVPADPAFLRDALGEVREVSLSRSGILLEGIRYHQPDETTLLLEDMAVLEKGHRRRIRAGSARARVTIKRAPWDISSIQVWNDVRKTYVRLPALNQRVLAGVRTSQWKILQEFARTSGLPFSCEKDQIEARLALVRRMQAGDPKARASSRRKAALILQDPPSRLEGLLKGSNVRLAIAEARHDGLSPEAQRGLIPSTGPATGPDISKGFRPKPKRKTMPQAAATSAFAMQAQAALLASSALSDGPKAMSSKAPTASIDRKGAGQAGSSPTRPDAAAVAARLKEWTGG